MSCETGWACIRAVREISLMLWWRCACSHATTAGTATLLRLIYFSIRRKPTYMGGLLEMGSTRLYGFWGSLTEGLLTGQPQSEVKTGGDFFEKIYSDPEKLAGFTAAMSGLSRAAGEAIAAKFPWRDYGSVIDIGCAAGRCPRRGRPEPTTT